MKARDFFQGVLTVDLGNDEILAKVIFAPAPASAYAKLHQRASRFAIVGVAAALRVRDGAIESASVALTGAASCASRLAHVRSGAGRSTAVGRDDRAGDHRGGRDDR